MAKVKNNTDLAIRVNDKSGFTVQVEPSQTREVPDTKLALCQGAGLSVVAGRAAAGATKDAKAKAPVIAAGTDTLDVNPD